MVNDYRESGVKRTAKLHHYLPHMPAVDGKLVTTEVEAWLNRHVDMNKWDS